MCLTSIGILWYAQTHTETQQIDRLGGKKTPVSDKNVDIAERVVTKTNFKALGSKVNSINHENKSKRIRHTLPIVRQKFY